MDILAWVLILSVVIFLIAIGIRLYNNFPLEFKKLFSYCPSTPFIPVGFFFITFIIFKWPKIEIGQFTFPFFYSAMGLIVFGGERFYEFTQRR